MLLSYPGGLKMIDYQGKLNYQGIQFKQKVIPNIINNFRTVKPKSFQKSYNHIATINLLYSRPELNRFWNDYLNWSISFLLKAYISASLGQNDACNLLLRSSLENFVKFIVVAIGKEDFINDRGFKDNNHILVTNSWLNDELGISNIVKTFQSKYNDFSKLSHSAINLDKENLFQYFDKNNETFKSNYLHSMNEIRSLSKNYIYLMLYICKPSFKNWNTNDLVEILKLIYNPKQVTTILDYLKK